MRRAAVSATMVIGVIGLIACGNGKGTGSTDPVEPVVTEPPPDPGPTLEEKLAQAQLEMCETLGPRITECALSEARKNLPAEQVAELEEPGVLQKHTREVIDECMSTKISVRQVSAANQCLAEQTECGPLLDCIETSVAPREQPDGDGDDSTGA